MRITRELVVSSLGHNLTATFGLLQLPPETVPPQSHSVNTKNSNKVFVQLGTNYLSISENEAARRGARFSVQARDRLRIPTYIRYAMYTRREDGDKHNDFEHNGREFMIKSHNFLVEVLGITIVGVIADWSSDESHFSTFSKAYAKTHDVAHSAQQTWAGPIIAKDLGYSEITARPHKLANLAHEESIDIYFTKTPITISY